MITKVGTFDEKIPNKKHYKSHSQQNSNNNEEDNNYTVELNSERFIHNDSQYHINIHFQDNKKWEVIYLRFYLAQYTNNKNISYKFNNTSANSFPIKKSEISPDFRSMSKEESISLIKNSPTIKRQVLNLKFQLLSRIRDENPPLKQHTIGGINKKYSFENKEGDYRLDMRLIEFDYQKIDSIDNLATSNFNEKYLIGRILPLRDIHSIGKVFVGIGKKEYLKIESDMARCPHLLKVISLAKKRSDLTNIYNCTYNRVKEVISETETFLENKIKYGILLL